MDTRRVIALGIGSRLVVVMVGCFLPHLNLSKVGPDLQFPDAPAAELEDGTRKLIQPWYRWDAKWYARISREGYSHDPLPVQLDRLPAPTASAHVGRGDGRSGPLLGRPAAGERRLRSWSMGLRSGGVQTRR